MKIFKKTFLIISISTLVVGCSLWLAFADFTQSEFLDLESGDISDDMSRVVQTLERAASDIALKAGDWSAWDETYNFLEKGDPTYLARNLIPSGLTNLDLHGMLIVDREKNLAAGIAYDDQGNVTASPSPKILQDLRRYEAIFNAQNETETHFGIVRVFGHAALVGTRPIVKTNLQGPILGTFIFYRYLDSTYEENLNAQFNLNLSFLPATSFEPKLRMLGDNKLEAFQTVRDINGAPALVLRLEKARPLHQRYKSFIRLSLTLVLVSSSVLLLVMLWLIDRLILHRLEKLRTEVQETQNAANRSEVTVSGHDEVSELAKAINHMLHDIQEAQARVEQAAFAKGQFLANMSHEIRTPMNAILGLTQLILDGEVSDENRNMLEMVQKSSESLLTILNDILDISKIEAGKLEIEKSIFSLREIAESVMRMAALQKGASLLEFVTEVAEAVPKQLWGDPTRIRQILWNLVGNAIKFTSSRGGVILKIDCVELSPSTASLLIHVIDTGEGIPADKMNSIFEAFNQADITTTRKYGGTGLGLTITKQLVEMMGGALTVHSREHVGTCFSVSLAFEVVHEDHKPESRRTTIDASEGDRRSLQGKKILLVEDNIVNQKVAVKLLQKEGCDVTIATNGQEAVELCQSDGFDLVLMDCQMPVMSGFEATAHIRAREKSTGKRVPIIALTAGVLEQDRERCTLSGMDAFVPKPIKKDELLKVLRANTEENS